MAHCLQHTPPFGPFWGSFGHECYRSRYDWCTLPLLFVAASVPQCPASRRQLLLPASRRGLPFFPITLCMRSGTSSELLVPFPALPCHSQPHHTPAGAQGKVVPSSAPLLATGRRACSCLPPKHSLESKSGWFESQMAGTCSQGPLVRLGDAGLRKWLSISLPITAT